MSDKTNRYAEGGAIQGSGPHDEDSITVRLSPGSVSFDGGETWHEVPEEGK